MSTQHRFLTGGAVLAATLVCTCSWTASTALAQAGGRKVQFVVSVPEGDEKPAEEIYCSTSLENWSENGRPLKLVGAGLYAGLLEFQPGSTVEYKFTRTKGWTSVEKSPEGEELPNRVLVVPAGMGELVVFNLVARWADQEPKAKRSGSFSSPIAMPNIAEGLRTGNIRAHPDFESPQLKNKRMILVYLPPDYEKQADERYPVLYLQDGNNVFDAKTSFSGVEWGVDETAERLIKAGQLRPMIIVAIANNDDRMKEYSPYADKRFGGEGERYLKFIVETLKPFIDKTYRTRADRTNTGIAGSSMGGLISLYAAATRGDVFGFAGVVSPALWWADRKIFETMKSTGFKQPVRLWIDIGTAEGSRDNPQSEVTKVVADCRELAALLKSKGLKSEVDFHYEEIDGAMHNEAAWAARVDRMLLYFAKGLPEAKK